MPDLYPRVHDADLTPALFRRPSAEYRGTPFWSWNTRLERETLLRQIDDLKAMGFGGFHIHPRTGLDTPYLGDEYMEHVRACAAKAREADMLCWLYDEDRWPSGFGGGLVTREPLFRAKHVLFTPTPYNGTVDPAPLISRSVASRNENGTLLARYHVVLGNGRLHSYRRMDATACGDDDDTGLDGRVWYAYLESAVPSPWWNNQTYVDTLDPAATAYFIAVTHERYAAVLGHAFGTLVPAIFTDEPQFVRKSSLRRADDTADVFLPWTTDFADGYRSAYGDDILNYLPEVLWELPGDRVSVARYRYHDYVAERFTASCVDLLASWCAAHGLALTGHLMEEPTLHSQTAALGEAMRPYRAFHIPGIDILCDRHEYTTAKQAQSAARQYGRPGVASELYGVTNWDFDFIGHKAQGDWQAALGVTVRVPHLSWVSMRGEAKRDFPASIHRQSPWYREYPLVEDHFARLNTALTRGRALARVAVVHPIESYWLCFGPIDQTAIEREERERAFADLTNWLLFGLVDFDFVAESLLPGLCPSETIAGAGGVLPVGAMRYDAVVVPALRTIRRTTLERLERFADAGGTVIFAGTVPALVDAEPSDRPATLATRCITIPLSRGRLLEALAPVRDVDARGPDGDRADAFLYQLRVDGDRRYLFLCNTDRAAGRPGTRLLVRGAWTVTVMDTMEGTMRPLDAWAEGDQTAVDWDAPPHGSLLLELNPGPVAARPTTSLPAPTTTTPGGSPRAVVSASLPDPVPVTLDEPNALLLDQAAYRLDDEPWNSEEEVLRVDNILRRRLGFPLKMEAIAQPWVERETVPPIHRVALRYAIVADIAVNAPLLALEDAAEAAITLDGSPVASRVVGSYVDDAIGVVALPALSPGRHELVVSRPFGRSTNLEWLYLLGDFGVTVRGRHARIIAPVRELAFGDWTTQGLPFYAGNVTYHCAVAGTGREAMLRVPSYKAPLLTVALDGERRGAIAFAPYRLSLGQLTTGTHTLDITAYGNRANAFGPVHNANQGWTWFGPNAWRTEGDDWSYQYRLKPMGILVTPYVE